MKKIILCILILTAAGPARLSAADPLEGLSLGLFGGYFLPAGYYADVFNPGPGFGVSAMYDIGWRYLFLDASALFASYSMKDSANSSMQSYTFTAGPGFIFPLTRWLEPFVSIQGGAAHMRFSFDQSGITSSTWKPLGIATAGVMISPVEYVSIRLGASYGVSELSEQKLYTAQFSGAAMMRLSVFAARNILDVKESLVRLSEIRLRPVWGARYAAYESTGIGAVKITNHGKETLTDIRVETSMGEIASGPTKSEMIRTLEPGKSVEVDLPLSVSREILSIGETRDLPVKLRTFYTSPKGVFSYIERKTVTVHSKNYLTWDDTSHIGSFITPQEETASSFGRNAIALYKKDFLEGYNRKLQEAMILFNTLGAAGISYATDPNIGYRKSGHATIDFVMFPRETLKKKAGDCDDLTVLYCALLENVGIKTAVVTVPGHILMMFDTEVPANSYTDITSEKSHLYFMNGTAWVPVEVTMTGKSFLAAWREGAKSVEKHRDASKDFEALETYLAWRKFPPADIGPGGTATVPSREKIDILYSLDMDELKTKGFDEPERIYKARLGGAEDYSALNNLGILNAKYGKLDQAFSYLKKAIDNYPERSPAYVNLGNIYLLQKKFDSALPLYEKAVKLSPDDHKYRLGLARALFETGKRFKAKEEYQAALKGNPGYARRYAYLDSDPSVRAADPEERAGYNMWVVGE